MGFVPFGRFAAERGAQFLCPRRGLPQFHNGRALSLELRLQLRLSVVAVGHSLPFLRQIGSDGFVCGA